MNSFLATECTLPLDQSHFILIQDTLSNNGDFLLYHFLDFFSKKETDQTVMKLWGLANTEQHYASVCKKLVSIISVVNVNNISFK